MKLTKDDILWAVRDETWQRFRLSLKGLPTKTKLRKLWKWRKSCGTFKARVQVQNYVNALKRGGQIKAQPTTRQRRRRVWHD